MTIHLRDALDEIASRLGVARIAAGSTTAKADGILLGDIFTRIAALNDTPVPTPVHWTTEQWQSVRWYEALTKGLTQERIAALQAENQRQRDLLRSALAVLSRLNDNWFSPSILDRLREALVGQPFEPVVGDADQEAQLDVKAEDRYLKVNYNHGSATLTVPQGTHGEVELWLTIPQAKALAQFLAFELWHGSGCSARPFPPDGEKTER